jgi:SAM-dependent methyltransferase
VTAVALVTDAGERIDLDVDRWRAEPDAAEAALLSWLPDPVLDAGCGPGRLTAAIAAAGRVTLGIDPSPAAIDEATRRGAPALRRSIFASLPGEGRWGSAVLVDGNIGIGGDPVALLRRIRELLRPGGVVVAELRHGGGCRVLGVRLDAGGRLGRRFPWAMVGAGAWLDLVRQSDLVPGAVVEVEGRRFGVARRR